MWALLPCSPTLYLFLTPLDLTPVLWSLLEGDLDTPLSGLELPGHPVVHICIEGDRDFALEGRRLHLRIWVLLSLPDLILHRLQ